MKIDFALLEVSDAIFLLKDWKDSGGAKRELKRAQELKKLIFFETPDGDITPELKAGTE